MRVSGSSVRRALLVLLSAVVLAGVASPAVAGAKTIVQIGGSAGPAIIPFTTTPQPLGLTVDVHFSTDVPGSDPGTITRANVFFSHGPRVNGALFPSCDPHKLQHAHGMPSACPRGSRLGTGSALGTSPQFHGVLAHLAVTLYNGPGGRSILFWFHSSIPITIDGMINAPLRAIHDHKWAYQLSLAVPRGLQVLGPGIYASLLRFTTHVGGSVRVREHGRTVRRSYIEALACPPGALVPLRSVFDFRDHSSTTANGYITCGG
jgi:hypothetical protein